MVPYLHQLFAVVHKMLYVWCKCSIIILKIDAGNEYSNGAIRDKFSTKASESTKYTLFDAQMRI